MNIEQSRKIAPHASPYIIDTADAFHILIEFDDAANPSLLLVATLDSDSYAVGEAFFIYNEDGYHRWFFRAAHVKSVWTCAHIHQVRPSAHVTESLLDCVAQLHNWIYEIHEKQMDRPEPATETTSLPVV